MLKKLMLILLTLFWISSGLLAQEVVLSDEFDNGDSKWNTGWIDNATTTVTVSIDNTGKLSGANSYKLSITKGGVEMWRVQRVADLPLVAGYKYTLSFMAVASKDAKINALFEIRGDPYTKYLNDTANVTTTPATFTYEMTATINVPDNQVKFHFGSAYNDNATIWIDKIIVTRTPDPSFVTLWGSTPSRGKGWPILNRQDTPPGDAGMGADGPPPTWATIRGGFGRTIEATTEKAIVVTGKFEYVGEGPGASYVPLRYALTYWTDEGTLDYQYTDTARWSGTGVHYGYEFTPRSAGTEMANGAGGAGTIWTINGGTGWNSTWANNGWPIAAITQKPALAEIVGGVYDFGISVRPLPDGTNEIRWFMYHVDKKYWFGGTVIDTAQVSTRFNGICFGVGDGITTNMKAFKLYSVRVELGEPITVPEAPWQAYYVENWGKFVRFSPSAKFVPGDVVGNASIVGKDGGQIATNQGWTVIRGGFLEPVTATLNKAIIIKGKMRFVGAGPSTWSALRFGLFYHDSAGTLQYKDTDSAMWSGKETYAKGYLLIPQSEANELPSWAAGGAGHVGVVRNSNWISTYGNNLSLGPVNQRPSRAKFAEGTYNFAISVQPKSDGTKELRFYIVKDDNQYWWGATLIDTTWIPPTFNGICFGLNGGNGAENNPLKEMHIEDVQIDMGDPIVIPEAPWQAYYVQDWGFIGAKTGGWLATPGDVIGNATIGGDKKSFGLAALRGAFFDPVDITTKKALIVTGKMELVGGGFEGWSSLRIGLNYNPNPGRLNQTSNGYEWSGSDISTGYLFIPHSGRNDFAYWGTNNTPGTIGVVVNNQWLEPLGAENYAISDVSQKPKNAVATAGMYDFAFSIQAKDDGKTEVRFYIKKDGGSYHFGGILLDAGNVVKKINSINFALSNLANATKLNLYDVQVDMGAPIVIPDTVLSVNTLTAGIPTDYILSQNYPNPFNPSTTIEFAIPKDENVSLTVYDVLGRVVSELVNENLRAGYYKVEFNASNLASGIYFYKLKAGDFVSTKKLILMK